MPPRDATAAPSQAHHEAERRHLTIMFVDLVGSTSLAASLDPEDRFVLQLLHGEGWTSAEIADRLGWSRSKVKVRAHRARKRLRARLTGEEKR